MKIMLSDFSSAYNTIPNGLELSGEDHHLSQWILDYLTGHPQYVRTQGYISDRLVCGTRAPQRTVLAPFLFILYTENDSEYTVDSGLCGLVSVEPSPDQRRENQGAGDGFPQAYPPHRHQWKSRELALRYWTLIST